MRAGEGVGLEPGHVDDGPMWVERHERSQAPLGGEVRRPSARTGDVVLLLPRPALVRPPFAALVAAALGELEIRGVRDRRHADLVPAHIGAVARTLVVVREALRGGADDALARRNFGQLEPGRRPAGGGRKRRALRRLVVAQPRELERLQHRLVVLVLVAYHQLVQDPVADAALLGDRERRLTHLAHVLAGRLGSQERQLAAAGSRGLHRVVYVDQLGPDHRSIAVAVDEPQVLERRDVTEVPHERAHQGRVHPLQVLVGDWRDELERPLTGPLERFEHLDPASPGRGCPGCSRALHHFILASPSDRQSKSPVNAGHHVSR